MAILTLQVQPEIKRTNKKSVKFYNELTNTGKSHPCDKVKAKDSEYEYGVKSKGRAVAVCRRYTENELLNRMNCSGTFNKNYLAVTREDAKRFPDLGRRPHKPAKSALREASKVMPEIDQLEEKITKRTRKYRGREWMRNLNMAEKAFFTTAEQDIENAQQKRGDDDMAYGEVKTVTENCLARWSTLDSVMSRPCGVCPTVTRQPQSPRRFPEYLNGLICHPDDTTEVTLSGNTIGRCVQETITLDLVQWTGEWVEDTALTAQNGVTTYVEKWDAYEQEINSTCSFSFYKS